MLFWNSIDLRRTMKALQDYYNELRVPRSLDATQPAPRAGARPPKPATLHSYDWHHHCQGLEMHLRSDRKRARLLQRANLKYPGATLEDAEFSGVTGIDRKTLTSLALSNWVERGDTILFAGPTGIGKSWLACALGQYACRRGHSVLYLRMPRLPEELRALHASGAFGKWLIQLARTDVLIIDDWATGQIDAVTRGDLLEIIDDRASQRATIITHQLPVEHWHGWIGDATIADAILDRLMQRVHRYELQGESRRTGRGAKATKARSKD